MKNIKLILGKKKDRKKQRYDLYAHIDWEKATQLFQRPSVRIKETRQYPEVKEILRVLAAAGTIGLMFIAPSAAVAVGTLLLGKKSYRSWRTRQLVERLVKQKYVSITDHNDGKITVRITKQGLVRAFTYELESMHLETPRRWDKKWRVVIFDIPEKYKHVRDLFRMRLRQLGLYQLQESVYIFPGRCFDEVEFLRELYGIPFTVRYLLVEQVEDDTFLRQYFRL